MTEPLGLSGESPDRIEPVDVAELCRAASSRFTVEVRCDVVQEVIAAAEALREVCLLSVELDHPTLLRWQRAKEEYVQTARFADD